MGKYFSIIEVMLKEVAKLANIQTLHTTTKYEPYA